MKIIFSHNKKKIEAPLQNECSLKLYAVPAQYSDDGYFVALWSHNELEPLPACDTKTVRILAHLEIHVDDTTHDVFDIFLAKEVSYALS